MGLVNWAVREGGKSMAQGSGWDQGTHPEGLGGKSMLTMGTGMVEMNIANEGEVRGIGTVGVGS